MSQFDSTGNNIVYSLECEDLGVNVRETAIHKKQEDVNALTNDALR